MNITIENLSRRQSVFAEVLWSFEDIREVDQFISSLPQSMRADGETAKHMIMAAVYDQKVNDDLSAALAVIRKLK